MSAFLSIFSKNMCKKCKRGYMAHREAKESIDGKLFYVHKDFCSSVTCDYGTVKYSECFES